MKRLPALKALSCVAALLAAGPSLPQTRVTPQLELLARDAPRDVIVILRDQLPSTPSGRGAHAGRAAALAAAQAPILAELKQAGARKIRGFELINAVAASVTADAARRLANNPLVQAVVADEPIKQQRQPRPTGAAAVDATTIVHAAVADAAGTAALCNTLEPEALQIANAAFLDKTLPQAQSVLDGNGRPVTGQGVRVAYLADGLDPTVPGFVRPDGTSVFFDYRDFSGDPAGTPTAGGEAFGDASSIAAQDYPNGKLLTYDISRFVSAAHPLPANCLIRIRGLAPGASLVGLKIFSNFFTTTSNFVQAIEWAVVHDDVDVINESFGGNPYPDDDNDPISLANSAALYAGVTVVASSGDAGSAGTLGSPSTNPKVISAGASTQYRFLSQTTDGGAALAHGFLSSNVSSFSSGGFSQSGPRSIDIVAPGELGWALCSTNSALYEDCSSFSAANPTTPIEAFGGTSESAPLTSAEAALVIQAYRSTHGGKNPTPALVKQIIMSTATDLGAPASEQGAGLINALAAVRAALSIAYTNGKPASRGESLLASPTTAVRTALPNSHETYTVSVTNTGATTRHLTPQLQTLGAPIAGATLNLQLDPATDPTFANATGAERPYIEQRFTVPAGAEHIDAAIAWQSPAGVTPIAYLALLDPSGKQVVYSEPQGFGSGYGHVDVVKPKSGVWTAAIWTRPIGVFGSYTGTVQFSWSAERYATIATISPASLDLAPGATKTLSVDYFMPPEPGDTAAAIRFAPADSAGAEPLPAIPLLLRTLIPLNADGGAFTGTLTGGNGRAGAGPTTTYAFDVPSGVNDLSLTLEIADNGYLLEGVLVDPNGMQVSVEGNLDPFGDPQYAMQLFHASPQPGRWRFVLLQNYTSSGNQTSLPFTARIGFNVAQYAATLPNDPTVKLSASDGPVSVPVEFVNTGAATLAYFTDARLARSVATALPPAPFACSPGTTTLPGYCAFYTVPTEVTNIQFGAASNRGITMDAYNDVGYDVGGTGNPDLYAKYLAKDTVQASLSVPEVPFGLWAVVPSPIGPYGASGASTATISTTAVATMKPFDAAVTSTSGDIWADLTLGTSTYNPLVLSPGELGRITLTITPDPKKVGKTITGMVFLDTYNSFVGTGDEVIALPYAYTIAP